MHDGYAVEFVGSQHNGAVPFAANEGHPGWTIPEIKNGLDAKRWLEAAKPNLILLHIGTNDIRLGHAAQALASLSDLLDDILVRLPRTQVIVAQIIPFRKGPDQEHAAYNDAIARIVAAKGARVSRVDLRNTLLPGDYADALHPNAGGYDKMARAWEGAIRAVLATRPAEGAAPGPAAAGAARATGNPAGATSEPEAAPGQGLRSAPDRTTRIEQPPAAEVQPRNVPREISARQPRGIYGVVLPPNRFPSANRPYAVTIGNPALAGLFLYFDWATLEPKQGQFDFSRVEEALRIADVEHKTLQLALLPGFWAPQWLLDQLPSCDGWLLKGGKTPPAPPQCGKASFGFPEGFAKKGEIHELPLPWNPVYRRAWHAFLVEFAQRFGDREAFVSIAVAGPTSQSEEIIMPHAGPGEIEKWARLLAAFYRDPSYQRSNKAFVEAWKAAIDDYDRIFSHVTLALTRAAGLPFNPGSPGGEEASTEEIAAYLAGRPVGSNARATQNNGITAARPLTLRPVKAMAADRRFQPRILAGGEFATGFSRDPAFEGCPSLDKSSPSCQRVTPEQAFANVLAVFFADTPYGHYYGARDGTAPVDYLQIYQDDILYANDHPPVQARLLEASKRIGAGH